MKIPKPKVRKGSSSKVRSIQPHKDRSKFDKSKERQKERNLTRKLSEAEILRNVRLNDNQKSVLALLATRNNEPTTLVDMTINVTDTDRQNIVQNIKILQNLGLLDVDQDKTLIVSDKGRQVMQDNGLVDQTGGLTPQGQKFSSMFQNNDKNNQEMSQSAFGEVPYGAAGGMGGPLPSTELPIGNAPMDGLPGEEGMMDDEGNPEQDVNNEQPGLNDIGTQQEPNEQQPMQAQKKVGESFSLLRKLADQEQFDRQISRLR